MSKDEPTADQIEDNSNSDQPAAKPAEPEIVLRLHPRMPLNEIIEAAMKAIWEANLAKDPASNPSVGGFSMTNPTPAEPALTTVTLNFPAGAQQTMLMENLKSALEQDDEAILKIAFKVLASIVRLGLRGKSVRFGSDLAETVPMVVPELQAVFDHATPATDDEAKLGLFRPNKETMEVMDEIQKVMGLKDSREVILEALKMLYINTIAKLDQRTTTKAGSSN